MAYLIHYNKNHDPKNGRFAPGDGNGDGVVNNTRRKKTNANKDYYITSSGEKIRKPLIEKEGQYTISNITRKNNAGIRLAYVSPNNLLREGYWIDADTGKKASFGNQWRGSPEDTAVKESGKSMFREGVNDTTNLALAGLSFANYYKNVKL